VVLRYRPVVGSFHWVFFDPMQVKACSHTGITATIIAKSRIMGAKTVRNRVEITYQDDDIVVVNKPAGVSVTKDRSGAPQLSDILVGQLGAEATGQLRLVHRLDKETSGVMILAKNLRAQSDFSRYFEKRLVAKTYLAVVRGPVGAARGTIEAPLAHSLKNPAVMCVSRKRGKEAVTDWELLADFGAVALLAAYPLTGRTHQVRVHLASVAMPLAIDRLYGSGRALFLSDFKPDYHLGAKQSEKPLIERLTLHAYEIRLAARQERADVISAEIAIDAAVSANRPDSFIAALDKKFAATIKMLTKYNPRGTAAYCDPDNFSRIMNSQSLCHVG